MKKSLMKANLFLGLACLGLAFLAPSVAAQESNKPKMATEMPAGITAPAEVQTRIGTLRTKDGFPDAATIEKVYDNLDFQRGDPAIPPAILGVKKEYLDAAFDEMQMQYGTIERYFSEGLGIDAAHQQALRDLYVGQE
jgi:hypothetical protein